MAEARFKLVQKDQVRRFEVSIAIMSQLLEEGPALVRGDVAERADAWRRCVDAVIDLWMAAASVWRSGHAAVATALSISCFEETGKVAVERFRLLGSDPLEIDTEHSLAPWQRHRLFRDHFTKHVMAAMAGALVNARLDRVLGMDFVIGFLDAAESQRLERLRQDCRYLDWKQQLHIPT